MPSDRSKGPDRYSGPPTPGQLKYIAILSSKLHISEPHVETFGEAGVMIAELKKEQEYRNNQRNTGNTGNNKNINKRRNTVTNEIRFTQAGKLFCMVQQYKLQDMAYYSGITVDQIMEIPGVSDLYTKVQVRAIMIKARDAGLIKVVPTGSEAKPDEMGYIASGTRSVLNATGTIGEAAGEGASRIGSAFGKGVNKAGDFLKKL